MRTLGMSRTLKGDCKRVPEHGSCFAGRTTACALIGNGFPLIPFTLHAESIDPPT